MDVIFIILTVILGYLLGSISFAIIISKIFMKEDIRNHGSGNAGMTNIMRTYGIGPAAYTLIGDILKGSLSAFLGGFLLGSFTEISPIIGMYIGGISAILGHIFPLYFKFKGGKAIATSAGVILVVNYKILLILLAIFIIVVAITKYISLGSIIGAISYPIIVAILCIVNKTPCIADLSFSLLLGFIVIYMHRGNIKRLLKGEESKLSFGTKKI